MMTISSRPKPGMHKQVSLHSSCLGIVFHLLENVIFPRWWREAITGFVSRWQQVEALSRDLSV